MIDLVTVVLIVAAAFAFRKYKDMEREAYPNRTSGSSEHTDTPEVDVQPALQINEVNASTFLGKGDRYQQGSFAMKDATQSPI